MQPPVIVLPGITASTLRDHYPLDPDPVWTILRKLHDRVALHPDDLRYEREEPARVQPDRIFSVPYDNFVAELRHNLADRQDEPVPVYPFAYDWRLPLVETQRRLGELIDEVCDRTRLLRHYHAAGYTAEPRVDLVAHSMGGLIIAGYLAATRDARVRKVATLGTPYRGSFEAVLKVVVGTAELGPGEQNSREREVARLTPALYHLVPSYEGGVISENEAWRDLFSAQSWQPGVVATIAEYLRLYGLEPDRARGAREEAATLLLQVMLDQARAHRDGVEAFRPDSVGMTADDWLVIAGVGEETRIGLHIQEQRGEPFFDLRSAERKNGWPTPRRVGGVIVDDVWETGDGTVPYPGAVPAFIGVEKIIALAPADFGYWELRDRLFNRFVGLHGMLPTMNVAQKLVVAFLRGRANERGSAHAGIWGRRAPDLGAHLAWQPPIAGLRER